ncbi:hypothetical protein XA68_16946 [Ophiocordyceps unilateralis]|uniref:Uncharacterized protein n=1 Tax=Ophiocordyceps unilateralis TaxID=268505 RepID=A0A2A9PL95_OPHUN|nr:hypothetical protein XA68_16946 [Ophiocordyceps unilateralis]
MQSDPQRRSLVHQTKFVIVTLTPKSKEAQGGGMASPVNKATRLFQLRARGKVILVEKAETKPATHGTLLQGLAAFPG